jgi:hypothetical protein
MSTINYCFTNACSDNLLELVRIFTETVNLKKETLIQGLKYSLGSDGIEVQNYLSDFIKLEYDDLRKLFIDECKQDNLNSVSRLLEKIREEDIKYGFFASCENCCYNVPLLLYNSNLLNKDVLDEAFLKCLLSSNIDVAKLIISKQFIDKKLVSKTFHELCLSNNEISLSFLLDHATIETEIVNSTLIECCKRRNSDIIKFLIRHFKISFSVRKECFLICLENSQYKLLCLFAREFDQEIIEHVRRNIPTSKLIKIFENVCLSNSVTAARWISNMIEIKNVVIREEIILKCFEMENIEILEFLIKYCNISSELLNKCFLECCKNGNLRSIKLLTNIDFSTIKKGYLLSYKNCHYCIFDYLRIKYKIDHWLE